MKTKLIALTLLAGGILFGQISVGIRIGPPPPSRVVVQSVRPGADFIWVDGYWYPVGGHYRWHAGYWTRPAYVGARWVGPRHDGERFFEGYWDGDNDRRDHDHRWDREHDRDFRDRRDHE